MSDRSEHIENKANEKYAQTNDKIKKDASKILKKELYILNNRPNKKQLTDIEINTVVGTFEMDDDPPSQIYEEYLEGSSIEPNSFYSRCCKSIDEATKMDLQERKAQSKKKTTGTGKRRKTRKPRKRNSRNQRNQRKTLKNKKRK